MVSFSTVVKVCTSQKLEKEEKVKKSIKYNECRLKRDNRHNADTHATSMTQVVTSSSSYRVAGPGWHASSLSLLQLLQGNHSGPLCLPAVSNEKNVTEKPLKNKQQSMNITTTSVSKLMQLVITVRY